MADLTPAMQEWVKERLSEWGAWEFDGLDFTSTTNLIYRLMKRAEADALSEKLLERTMCCDDVGMLMNQIIGYYIKNPDPQAYKYLESKYVYGLSVRQIAKYNRELSRKNKEFSLRQWQNRVRESIKASEWIVAKMLDSVIKNHKRAAIFQKVAFKG